MKMVLVDWIDAWSQGPGWEEPPKPEDTSLCHTVGFIIQETDDYLGLAGSWDGDKYFQGMMFIPKVNIVKRKALK